MNTPDPIFVQLRDAREKRRWSAAELGRRAKVSPAAVTSYERGDRNAPLSAVRLLAQVLGRRIVALPFGAEGHPTGRGHGTEGQPATLRSLDFADVDWVVGDDGTDTVVVVDQRTRNILIELDPVDALSFAMAVITEARDAIQSTRMVDGLTVGAEQTQAVFCRPCWVVVGAGQLAEHNATVHGGVS